MFLCLFVIAHGQGDSSFAPSTFPSPEDVFKTGGDTALTSYINSLLQSDEYPQEAKLEYLQKSATLLRKKQQFERSIEVYELLIKEAERSKDSLMLASGYIGAAHSLHALGMLNRALDYAFQGLSISEQSGLVKQKLDALIRIGIVKKDLGMYTEAIQYYESALEIAQSTNNQYWLGALYNNLGSVYKLLGIYSRAKELFLTAIEINKANGFKRHLSYNYNNLANTYEESGDLENARLYHEKSIELKKELGENQTLAVSYGNIALVYMKLNQFERAREYLDLAKEYTKKYRVTYMYPDLYSTYAALYSRQSNYKKAFSMLEKLIRFKDSIAAIDRNELISQYEARYNQQIIEHENKILRKNIEIAKAQNFKKNIYLSVFAGCVILLIIVVILYYITNRARTEANERLRLQNDAILKQSRRLETQRKRLEEASEKLEQLQKDKDLFFSTISHDMRGPLNAIATTVMLMKEKPESQTLEEELMVLEYSVQNLESLVEDILDFANLEQNGDLKIEYGPFTLQSLLDPIAKPFEFLAKEKQIDFVVQNRHAATEVVSDVKRIRQVIYNLLSNAFKFTSEGFVKLTLDLANHRKNVLKISVQDTGIGIPKDKLESIFLKFEQADNSVYKEFGGSGLGLFIAKSIVDKLGGSIAVDSTPDLGTTFTVEIPLGEG
ncbi:MAG: hypothetical protein Kow0075_12880 [Salibacteraceae bacterium]